MTPTEILAFADRAVLCYILEIQIDISFNHETVLAYNSHEQKQSIDLQADLYKIRTEQLVNKIEDLLETQELLTNRTFSAIRKFGLDGDKMKLEQIITDTEIMNSVRNQILLSWKAHNAMYHDFYKI